MRDNWNGAEQSFPTQFCTGSCFVAAKQAGWAYLSQGPLLGGVPGVVVVVREGQVGGVLLVEVGGGLGGPAPVALQERAHLANPLQALPS